MGTITTTDGTEIFYKDWGSGQPIVFSHGWPLSADDWDTQMLFFLGHGFRVVAVDRRGHGRSTQTSDGHDMDHYADDLAAVVEHLDLHDAIHVGHSTGGGEVTRYIGRHGESRVAKAVLISSVPPLMVKTDANPGGLPKSVFDDLQAQLAANRSEFYRALPSGPFYGYNRPGAKPSEAIIQNWWRQGMMGGAKAHYDGVVAFSQTDFTEDLKKISVPVLVMHGEDDQIVPYPGPLSAKLVQNGTLKSYPGFPQGCRPPKRRRSTPISWSSSSPAVRQTRAERNAEELPRLPPWDADHRSADDQRRSLGVHSVLTLSHPNPNVSVSGEGVSRRAWTRSSDSEIERHTPENRANPGNYGGDAAAIKEASCPISPASPTSH